MIKFEEEEERVINLIQRQKESFINILNLKDETEVQERFDDLEDQITIHGIKVDWDVFAFWGVVMDEQAVRILSTLLHISDFWLANIAYHAKLFEEKWGEIKETAMLYLVNPTDENIQWIIEDFSKNLYDYVFLEFLSPISNSSLKSLAQELAKIG